MISLIGGFSVSVRHTDDGETVYQLLDGYDDVVAERSAGSCYTSSEASMKEIGSRMLEDYLEAQNKIAKRRRPRRLVINIVDDTTDLQAINLVRTVVELGRKTGKAYPPSHRFTYQDGVETFVAVRKKSETIDSFRVWKEQ